MKARELAAHRNKEQRMMQEKQKTRWIIAAVLFGGFLLALCLDLTGLPVHQWLGLAIGALACYHLAAHGRWVVAVTGRLFGRTSRQARRFYAIDAGLAVGFVSILVTGLVISTWLNLALASYAGWRAVHVAASILTLALVIAKIGLHWRWIVAVARRSIFLGLGAHARPDSAHPASAAVSVERRDFLRLMGAVGVVALLAGVQALSGGDGAETQASSAAQAPGNAKTLASASSGGMTSPCVVRCRKQCSYPGHCRRYVDTDGNGRCDLGECLS
jgi:hypothetical protein